MKRPLWLIDFGKAMYKLAHLVEKYSILARILSKVRGLPIWKLIKLTPVKYDYVFTLPKDNVVQVNKSLDTPKNIVLPSQILEHFIKKSKYHFIVNFCFCRYSNECKDYPIEYGCLFLGEAASTIPLQFGRLVSMEEALDYAKKCRELGLVHLIGKAYPDKLIFGAEPHDKLMTVCNCCECCCGLGLFKHVPLPLAKTYVKMPGIELRVTDKCVGCGTCAKNICFIDAIHVINKRAVINNDCRGCGRCAIICPNNAIEFTIIDKLFIEKGIKRIEAHVNVE